MAGEECTTNWQDFVTWGIVGIASFLVWLRDKKWGQRELEAKVATIETKDTMIKFLQELLPENVHKQLVSTKEMYEEALEQAHAVLQNERDEKIRLETDLKNAQSQAVENTEQLKNAYEESQKRILEFEVTLEKLQPRIDAVNLLIEDFDRFEALADKASRIGSAGSGIAMGMLQDELGDMATMLVQSAIRKRFGDTPPDELLRMAIGDNPDFIEQQPD
jgi:hypothetical protein